MISDDRILELFNLQKDSASLAEAARQVGIDYSTALKYKKAGRLPSEIHKREGYTRNRLFDDIWERDIVPLLHKEPMMSASELITHLIETNPKKYKKSQIRTLRRRMTSWRDKAGIILDRFHYTYSGTPGSLIISTFIQPPFQIQIRGIKFYHYLFLAYLPFTKWVNLQVKSHKKPKEMIEGMQGALWKLGWVPYHHLHWSQDDDFRVNQTEYLLPRIIRDFIKHYSISPVDPQKAIPAKLHQIKKEVARQMGELKEKEKKFTVYATRADYERDISILADHLNNDIPKEYFYMESENSHPLPAKGFNYEKTKKAVYSSASGIK
jgi:hypothetical protein